MTVKSASTTIRMWRGSLLLCALTGLLLFVQTSLNAASLVVGRIYVAEAKGEVRVIEGKTTSEARQTMSFEASGRSIETGVNARGSMALSNGTAISLDQRSQLEIRKFEHQPLAPGSAASTQEPSPSFTSAFLHRGSVAIFTPPLQPDTIMTYETPHAVITVKGRRLVLTVEAEQTVVYVVDGNATVAAKAASSPVSVKTGGMITLDASGTEPAVSQISAGSLPNLEVQLAYASNAQDTVAFEMGAAGEESKVEAKASVPKGPPSKIVVSPNRKAE